MTPETKYFLACNRRRLVTLYADYLDDMVQSEQFRFIEDFPEWVTREHERALEEKGEQGESGDYEI